MTAADDHRVPLVCSSGSRSYTHFMMLETPSASTLQAYIAVTSVWICLGRVRDDRLHIQRLVKKSAALK